MVSDLISAWGETCAHRREAWQTKSTFPLKATYSKNAEQETCSEGSGQSVWARRLRMDPRWNRTPCPGSSISKFVSVANGWESAADKRSAFWKGYGKGVEVARISSAREADVTIKKRQGSRRKRVTACAPPACFFSIHAGAVLANGKRHE